jgi:hypothetical protein
MDQPNHFFCHNLSKNIKHSLAQLQCMLNHGHNTAAVTPSMPKYATVISALAAPPAPPRFSLPPQITRRECIYRPSGDDPSMTDMIPLTRPVHPPSRRKRKHTRACL